MRQTMLLLVLICSYSWGQDYMRVKMKDGSLQVIPLKSITKITFSTITSVDDKTAGKLGGVVKTLTLLQNYPNPFNPTTTINYAIPKTDAVMIRIYDVTGRLVRSLAAGVQEAGEHHVQWDSRDNHGRVAASGLYVYEIRYQGSVLTRKMMLLK